MDWNVRPADPPSKRTRRRAFFVGAVAGLFLPIPLLAALPISPVGHRDPRIAEGTQLAGSLRDQIRVHHSKTGSSSGGHLPVSPAEYTGDWYRAVDVWSCPTPKTGEVYLVPLDNRNSTIVVRFSFASGESEVLLLEDE